MLPLGDKFLYLPILEPVGDFGDIFDLIEPIEPYYANYIMSSYDPKNLYPCILGGYPDFL